jgi:hypothetical protein
MLVMAELENTHWSGGCGGAAAGDRFVARGQVADASHAQDHPRVTMLGN